MTVTTELNKDAIRLEYFICIEGIGWPYVETGSNGGSADGFEGKIFSTADLDGNLTSKIQSSGARLTTYPSTLALPGSIEESFDPLTMAYRVGGMSFEIQDFHSVLSALSPHKTATTDTLTVALGWEATTVTLDVGTFVEGDTIWIAGRECVRLGSKSASGGDQVYTGSLRGYLGSPRGRGSMYLDQDYYAKSWPIGTTVLSINKFLANRRVRLYAHVPGELASASGCMLLYSGRLTGFSCDSAGMVWRMETTGDTMPPMVGRIRKAPTLIAKADGYFTLDGRQYTGSGYVVPDNDNTVTPPQTLAAWEADDVRAIFEISNYVQTTNNFYTSTGRNYGEFAISALYHYRPEDEGTTVMIDRALEGLATYPRTPLTNTIAAYITIGENIYKAIKRRQISDDGTAEYDMSVIVCDPVGPNGELALELKGGDVRILLDNITDDYQLSRFQLNRTVTRRPTDVLAMFLTTMPGEYLIFDTTAGTTDTLIKFSGTYTTDCFVGKALHICEGSTTKYYARKITANSSSAGTTTITLESALPATPSNGTACHIRNTLYDCLPISWGIGIDVDYVDLSGLESLGDEHLSDAELGKFVLGNSEQIDLLGMVQKEICQPYGILMYLSRLTGKLSFRFAGEVYSDGVFDTFTAVGESSIYEVGEIDLGATLPVNKIVLSVRGAAQGVVGFTQNTGASQFDIYGAATSDPIYGRKIVADIGAKPQDIELIVPEYREIYPESKLSETKISAMLNSVDDCDFVAAQAYGRLIRAATKPPRLRLLLSHDMLQNDVQPGAILSITHSSVFNPFTGTLGLSGQAARIISSRVMLSDKAPGVELEVELLPQIVGARIAPACIVTAKGSDGNGDYVTCSLTNFVTETTSDRDHYYFAVNDKITLFDANGLEKEVLGTITGFGTNFASTPTGGTESGSTIRIYVNDTIASAIATGDYVTLKSADGGARAQKYSEYATSGGTLTDATNVRKYGS